MKALLVNRWLFLVAICGVPSSTSAWGLASSIPTLPEERSNRPSPRAWREESTPLPFSLQHGAETLSCRALAVREWVKVSCPELKTAALRLAAGEARNLYFHIDEDKTAGPSLPGGGEVVFAARRGDQRIIEFWTFGPGYDGPLTVIGALTLQESWPEEEEAPLLVLTATLHEPIRTATADGK